ncbi:class I SAM-dependent methyltransferase [Ornithinibacillus halophilus]|uniref:Site-specific DNA-methyltransferase (Adenine-specific) n=1 Tax=Ornithinibacillus halophilus TaxID=930117 RepID=A0A1M5EJ12_9BACI|nr:class I SAM-dependent methyltransferase [Ornithinibacillus halophilus]SHF79187.1 site-specific DNA-methyltransferase (adenine-specific) [Ornithinibacillus halophilus]
MEKTKVETLFEWLDSTTMIIEQHENETYLESLVICLETLFYNSPEETMDDILSHKLETALGKVDISSYKSDEIRKAIQFAILKGMKDTTQQQHLLTPESVGLLVGYLAEKLTKDVKELRVFDPASGTANLLTTVMGHIDKPMETFASEVDPTLIQLAVISANIQQRKIEFFHQDSLRPFLMDPVDLVVSDLPVGYYPDDIRAKNFQLKADEGHSYAHHLFIEQSMNYTKEAGYLIFVVPNFLFDSDQSDKLHAYIQEYGHIIGMLQLPDSIFKSEKQAKSILILQKKGENTSAPKQPLLVQLPSLKNTKAMEDILAQMNNWFASYKN